MEKKVFLFGALVLGLMTSVGTGVLAQERGLDPAAPGKMEAFDKEPLINQESPEAPAGTVTGEAQSENFTLNSDIINHIKQQCDRRNPKVMNEALNKACTAVGCSGSYDPLNPCGVE